MSIKKQYLKNGKTCKVTFSIKDYPDAESARVLGDFNGWNRDCEPMKKTKNGVFSTSINFDMDREYQFRYLIDNSIWVSETEADKLIPNGIDPDEYNSLLII